MESLSMYAPSGTLTCLGSTDTKKSSSAVHGAFMPSLQQVAFRPALQRSCEEGRGNWLPVGDRYRGVHLRRKRLKRCVQVPLHMSGRNLATGPEDLEVYSLDSHGDAHSEDVLGSVSEQVRSTPESEPLETAKQAGMLSGSESGDSLEKGPRAHLRVQEGLGDQDLSYHAALALEVSRIAAVLYAAKKGIGWSASAIKKGVTSAAGGFEKQSSEGSVSDREAAEDDIDDVDALELDSDEEPAARGGDGREEPWDIIKKWWNNPAFFRLRVSLSLANLSISLPTMLARFATIFATFLPGRVSLPILAPLLFGSGLAFKSVVSNVGFVLPRLAVAATALWSLWAVNFVLQEAVTRLRSSGVINLRVANAVVLAIELTASAIAVVTILSTIGVKVSSLLLPFFAAVALAGKDVWHNYSAGFFLFAAQPFRPGDTVALVCGGGSSAMSSAPGGGPTTMGPGWFEGVCESVDLRYTVLRSGRRRLMVPNSHFVCKEFMVTDAGPIVARPRGPRDGKQDFRRGAGGSVGKR